jgi:hypothetical protein
MSTVAPPPPEDKEDVLHRRKTASSLVTTVLLGLVLLRGDAAIVLLEHIALLEGVIDRGLVVWAQLLQHVVKHVGASWGRSGTLTGRVDCKGLIFVLVAPLRACIAAGLLALLPPLMLLLGLLGLAALLGRVVHALAFLAVEDAPHRLLSGRELGGNIEQLVGVDRRAPPELAHKFSIGHALEEGVHDLRLSHAR